MEQQLSEHGEKIPAEMRGKVESAINNVREVLKGDDADSIKKAHEALLTEAQAIGKIVYEEVSKQQAAADAAKASGAVSGTAESGVQDDNVIDAEFEVKDAK